MLQWMGGSRRKVATSRKSTNKRQKQYFEQRKRQLQEQTVGLESYFDGNRSCPLQCDYSRSLDILSLENVSTVAQQHKARSKSARDNSENDDFTLNNQDADPSQFIPASDGINVDQSEINRQGTSSTYVMEAEYPEKVSVHLPKTNENFGGNFKFNELDSFKSSMWHQISVIDLLGDGANSNGLESSSHEQEAHVAFSVEGLGQVETQTPDHSPRKPGRSFQNCYTPPKKAARVPITSKHLEYGFNDLGSGLDDMVQDIDFSPRGSTMDQPFCTRELMNAAGDPHQNFSNFRRLSSYNWNSCNVQGVLGNDEFLDNNQDSSRRIWEGPSFLDDGIDDLREHESFLTNFNQIGEHELFSTNFNRRGQHESFSTSFDRRDVGFDDSFRRRNLWKQDLNLEGWEVNKRRSSIKSPETYNWKESPGPFPKNMEDSHGIRISNTRWHSGIEIHNNVEDAADTSVTQDSRERSLLRFEIRLLACGCTYRPSFYPELIMIRLTYSEITAAKNHALPQQRGVLQPKNHNYWSVTENQPISG